MPPGSRREDTFENSAQRLFGCLVQWFLVFILIANILAYVFSERYRSTFPVGRFILYTLAWIALTAGFWWMMRGISRLKDPFQTSRPVSGNKKTTRRR